MSETGATASLRSVSFSYDGGATWALDHVDLEVDEGEHLCLLGANGSGKSTLGRVLAGLAAPDEGTVELMGLTCFDGDGARGEAYGQARRSIAMVFQNPDDQIVTTKVADDVAFGPENLGWSPERIDEVVARELRRVALSNLADADPTRLSGGQKQRVAIAGALAQDPRLLVLDEPAANLDVRGRRGVRRLCTSLDDRAVVHITHFMEDAAGADRVIVMDGGRIALEGTPDEVLSRDDELRRLSLEPPFPVALARALADRGVAVAPTLDPDRLAASVAALAADWGSDR